MNKTIKLFSAFLFVGLFFACKKNISMITFDGGTPPVVSANKTTIPLAYNTRDNEAVTFSWTNPNYKFSTGLSSQNVNYVLEFDTAGGNFGSPSYKVIGVTPSGSLSKTFIQSELNTVLFNQMKLQADVPHNIEVRITSTLVNNTVPLKSNVLKFTVTPYSIPPAVPVPSTGRLYMVGNATPGGWANPVDTTKQKFTKLSPTSYTLTINLIGGNSYLFLPLNGDWGTKYGGTGGGNNSNIPSGDTFKMQGSDLLAPAASGTYRVDVDFQAGVFSLTKL